MSERLKRATERVAGPPPPPDAPMEQRPPKRERDAQPPDTGGASGSRARVEIPRGVTRSADDAGLPDDQPTLARRVDMIDQDPTGTGSVMHPGVFERDCRIGANHGRVAGT